MDAAAQKVERNLSETSRNCNSRLLERKARNLKMFEERVGAAGMGWARLYDRLALIRLFQIERNMSLRPS